MRGVVHRLSKPQESAPHSRLSALGRLWSPPSRPQRAWPSPSLQSAPVQGTGPRHEQTQGLEGNKEASLTYTP